MSMIRLSIKPLTSTIPEEHSDLHWRCRWARELSKAIWKSFTKSFFFPQHSIIITI